MPTTSSPSLSPPAPPRHSRLRGMLRVCAFVLCLAMLGGAWFMHRVHAQVSERALAFGEGLARAHDLHAGSTRVRLNGAVLTLNTSASSLSVDATLDRFAQLCAAASGPLGDAVGAKVRSPSVNVAPPSWHDLSVFRTPTEHGQGTAACFARNRQADGISELLGSVGEALESGDLAKIGQFRYVFARKSEHSGGTHVISVWSEGALKVEDMFPEHGDAPGLDLVQGVRPARARRFVAAEVEGSRFQLALYESEDSPERALDSYHRRLAQHGYVAMDPAVMDEALPIPGRVYSLDGRDRIVVLAQGDGAKTLVSTFRLGSSGSVALTQP